MYKPHTNETIFSVDLLGKTSFEELHQMEGPRIDQLRENLKFASIMLMFSINYDIITFKIN